MAVAYWLFAGY